MPHNSNSVSETWATPKALIEKFKEHGLTKKILRILVKIGSLTHGRPIKCRTEFSGLIINLSDVQAEIDAARARPGGQPYSDWAKHPRFVTPKGIEYRTTRSARDDLGLPWSRQTFKRFHINGSLIFFEDKLEPVKLDRQLIPVYEGRGIWRAISVWRKDQLDRAKGRLVAGKIIHPDHGEGLTYPEAKALGFGKEVLRRAVLSESDGGKPFLELDGQLLDHWEDGYRIRNRERKSKKEDGKVFSCPVLKQHHEYSKAQLDRVLERRAQADSEQMLSDSQIDSLWENDQRFQIRRRGQVQPLFEAGDLLNFRNAHKQMQDSAVRRPLAASNLNESLFAYLGKMLGSVKVPSRFATRDGEGEWRTPIENLTRVAAELKKRILTIDNPYVHTNGNSYIPSNEFLDESGYGVVNRGILTTYVDRMGRLDRPNKPGKAHPALGCTIDFVPFTLRGEDGLPIYYIRRNSHSTVKFYSLADARKIREYLEAHRRVTPTGRRRAYPDSVFVSFLKRTISLNGPIKVKDFVELGDRSKHHFNERRFNKKNRDKAGLLSKRFADCKPAYYVWYVPGQNPRSYNPSPQLSPEDRAPNLPAVSNGSVPESLVDAERPTSQTGRSRVAADAPAGKVASGPLGIQLHMEENKAERNGVTVVFGSRVIPWKMFVLLCRRHPGPYREIDLGHDACNPDNNNDDPGSATVRNHVARIRKIVRKLKLDIENERGVGYRLVARKRQR